ncbi:MAG: LytTR family DNA-binding domain-containing protein [Bacteroidales bacterium]|nr:LytTR family DNA-binding domain-containing protein [Bacteroidales bacterium]MCF8405412.1 LytTR family DNA-binding domain-containing protein [Bacteroidales bacterium]
MIKAVIIEDEKRSRETLSGLLKLYCKNVNVVAEAEGMRSGIKMIKLHQPDLVFLDIQMPDGSGFNLLESFEKIEFDVVFTTAYDQFAIKAIKFSALDYLLKPIFPDDLVKAVKKAEDKKQSFDTRQNVDVLLENIKKPDDFPKIVLSTSDRINVVRIDHILRCESDNYYTMYFFMDGTKLLVSKTLKENEELLSEYNFIRPHKSHLVNAMYIKSFVKQDNGYIAMTDGSMVPVSRRKKEKMIEIINNL